MPVVLLLAAAAPDERNYCESVCVRGESDLPAGIQDGQVQLRSAVDVKASGCSSHSVSADFSADLPLLNGIVLK
jgi:hypothetical protein